MYDVTKAADITRLQEAAKVTDKKMEPFRNERNHAVRAYLGSHYGDDASEDKVPVNFLALALNVYIRHLIARRPRVLIDSDDEAFKPYAKTFEGVLNTRIKKLNLQEELARWVFDAIFRVGILAVGRDHHQTVEIEGMMFPVTKLYARVVDLDDWIYDMNARHWEDVTFAGYRQRMHFDAFKASPVFDKKVTALIKPSGTGMVGGDSGQERVETITKGDDYELEGYEPYVDFWHLWLKRESMLVDIPIDQGTMPLAVTPWTGDDRGPFHILGYGHSPQSLIPVSPLDTLLDLHELANNLMSKMEIQAEAQRTVIPYRGTAASDAERMKKAGDVEWVAVDHDPSKNIREYNFGGVDPRTMATFLQVKQLFFTLGGNLDALGGLSPQSQTLGQDEMLTASASKLIEDMQEKTMLATGRVIEAIAALEWEEQVDVQPARKRIGDTDLYVRSNWGPEHHQGRFTDYDVDIEPYSMQDNPPQARLQKLAWLLQLLTPYLPQIMQQGNALNWDAILTEIGRNLGIPNFRQMILTAGSPDEGAMGGQERQLQSPTTTRTNVRKNVPGASRQGQDDVMARLMMGSGAQDSEMNAMARGIG